jgi:hypothetical protein
MSHYLLIGAGFSRNWGGPLSEEITGSLLGELHDDAELPMPCGEVPSRMPFRDLGPPLAHPTSWQRNSAFRPR